MNRLTLKYRIIVGLLFCANLRCIASELITGNSAASAGQTFSFPVQAHVFSPTGENLYVGAHPTLGTPQEFTISAINRANTKFIPLAPQKSSINGQDTDDSPLYNKHVQYMALFSDLKAQVFGANNSERPLLVLSEDITSVYMIQDFAGKIPVLVAKDLHDAQNNVTSGIVGIGNIGGTNAVAAVKSSSGGNFGDVGSGIAFLKLATKAIKDGDKQKNQTVFEQTDAVIPGVDGVVRAVPLDVTSAVLKINSDLSSIGSVVNFYWDMFLERLYVILQVQAGAGATDGARAVFVGVPTQGDKLQFLPIAVEAVFSGAQNKIIGAVGANAQVSLHHVKTMWSSDNFPYLIVVGGNGAPSATTRTAFALPLVNNKKIVGNGTIANKLENPAIPGRGFSQTAQDESQMTIATDLAAQIGGGPIAAGEISSLFVRGDAVYVTIQTADAGYLPGIYSSQAILDARGAIQRWTEWRRVAGNTDQVFAADVDQRGNFLMMDGISTSSVQTVKRTVWGTNDADGLLGGTTSDFSKGFLSIINVEFPIAVAGVQGLFDFPAITTPGLNGIALTVSTGLKKIILAEMGNSSSGSFVPNVGDYLTYEEMFSNGTITKDLPSVGTTPRVVIISGGVLNDLGPITAAEIARSGATGSNGWLFVGGIGGLAVLTNPDGTGWDATAGLGPNFDGLKNNMAFKKVGNYTFVRKLVYDGDYLYVLTDTALYRINLVTSNFGTGALDVRTLATPLSILGLNQHDTFTDLLITGKFALLTSSKGLHRVGNGKDITQAQNPADVAWENVLLPESVGPATRLFAISVTGRAQDVAQGRNGNIYVLNAFAGKNQAQLIRFVINDVQSSPIDNNTMQLLPDFYVVGVPAALINFNGFRDIVTYDGSAQMNGKDRHLTQEPFVTAIQDVRSGVPSGNGIITTLPLTITTASHVTTMLRNSASGSWLVAGDFGLRVSE